MAGRVQGFTEAMSDETTVRVLLVEDHEMVARGLQAALEDEPDLEVVGLAGSVAAGVASFVELKPDVTVMDFRLPDGEGTDATRRIRIVDDEAPVLLLTGADDPNVVSEALDAGCSGFVTKDRGVDELASAIRSVARGAAVFPAGLLARALSPSSTRSRVGDDLTGREREVLVLLAAGRSTEEMAAELFLSLHTVRNHVRNILTKLHARTKLEAVVISARAGIVDLRPER
jgi:DNA-binding NarL/FixJ family response regulator